MEKTTQSYMQGKITLSEAAHRCDLTMLEFEHYLVDQGFKSMYSIEDLREMELLNAADINDIIHKIRKEKYQKTS